MPALSVRRGEPAFAATLLVAETFLLIQLESESHRRKLARLQFFEETRDNPVLLHCAPTLLGAVILNYGDPTQLRLLPVSSLRGNISSEPDSAVIGTPFNDFRIFHTAWSIAKNFSDTANVVSD